MKKKHAEIMD